MIKLKFMLTSLRKSFLVGFSLLLACSCTMIGSRDSGRQETLESPTAQGQAFIEFEKTTHEFGRLQSGEKVSYAFRFTNTGQVPLVITGTRSGCGCTVGEYSQQPIAPGQTGRVNVLFDSAGRRGFQSESIRVFTNAEPSEHVLRVTAEVFRD